jgi:hypothetical protein
LVLSSSRQAVEALLYISHLKKAFIFASFSSFLSSVDLILLGRGGGLGIVAFQGGHVVLLVVIVVLAGLATHASHTAHQGAHVGHVAAAATKLGEVDAAEVSAGWRCSVSE